jgi:hypothetical protein
MAQLYISNRARLKSAAMLTPHQKTKKWMTQYGVTGILTVIYCAVWCGLVLLASQLVLFFGGHYFFRFWDEEEERINVFTIYDHPVTVGIRIGGILLIIILMIIRQKKRLKR